MKRFKSKKNMWDEIASDIYKIVGITKTSVQCDNRYKTIMKRKKKVDANNHTSGSSRQVIEYEDEIRKIAAIDDSIEPEVLRGPGKTIYKKPLETSAAKNGNREHRNEPCNQNEEKEPEPVKKKRKARNAGETLLEIQKMKEENKERRHKEKMELMKELISVMTNK